MKPEREPGRPRALVLPALETHAPRGSVRPSRRTRTRAIVLLLVHVAVLVHVAHWKISGSTLTPMEPSEAMQTLELGYVNAGFILFAVAILATLVLGRFFCGWACHVVAYQDLCAWLLAKVGVRPRLVRSRLLALVPLGAAFYMFVWPQLARLLAGHAPAAWSAHFRTESFWATFPGPWVAALTILVDGFLVVYVLGAKGFCTYGCPYGAVFGAVDRAAPGRIRVTDACEGCGHCTATCTSNVRVHAEVAKYGMVVDPGCMKCMDCVNVCPKDALYFGFTAKHTRERAKPPRSRARREYDFTWREELAMAAVFALALYALRDLYELVPFLLAIGLATIAAVASVLLWRLLRARSVTFQHYALRSDGRWTGAGRIALVACTGLVLLVLESTVVQVHAREGTRLLERAGTMERSQREGVIARSLAHLSSAERWGLVPVGSLQLKIGSILREQGDLAGAEQRMRRAIEIDPSLRSPRLALADLLILREDFAGAARVLDELLAIDPKNEAAALRARALEARVRQ